MSVDTEIEIDQHEAIAERAYEISQSDEAGGDLDNWLQAEREMGGNPASSESEPAD
jgi:hypothetical protein